MKIKTIILTTIITLLSFLLYSQSIKKSTLLGGDDFDHFRASSLGSDGSVYIGGKTSSSDFPLTDSIYGTNGEMFLCKMDSSLSQIEKSIRFSGVYDEAAEIWAMKYYNNELFVVGLMPDENPETFPITNIIDQSSSKNGSIFIAKFSNDLDLISSSYFGRGIVRDFSFDNTGNIYIVGGTYSSIPILGNSYQENIAGSTDGYIIKISNNIDTIISSTYIGGSNWDIITDIIIDSSNNIFVSGQTESPDLPTTNNSYQQNLQSPGYTNKDIFLCKFSNNLSILNSLSYYGGNKNEYVNAMAIENNNILLFGLTNSDSILIKNNGIDSVYNGGENDYFLARFSNNFDSLLNSTYIGGASYEGYEYGIEYYYDTQLIINNNSRITIAGITGSDSINNYNTNNLAQNYSSIFILEINATFDSIFNFSTIDYNSYDYINEILYISNNEYYLFGSTLSTDFYTSTNCFDSTLDGNQDLFIIKYDMDELNNNISEIKQGKVKIFPNPTNDFIIVSNSLSPEFNISIFNMSGQIVYSKMTKNNERLDINNLDAGLYLIRLISNNVSLTKKLIILD